MPTQANVPGMRSTWWINEVSGKIQLTMRKRVKIATDFLKQRVVQNIKEPVSKKRHRKTKKRAGYTSISGRSKSGEFPKADTTQLLKSIIGKTSKVPGGWEGVVGTPLHYGLILETKMDRSFLLRTLNENQMLINKILTGPIVGG